MFHIISQLFLFTQDPVTLPRLPGSDDILRVIPAPVNEVFIPAYFDDNDNVQIVLSGVFKNACQSLGPAKAQLDLDNHRVLYSAIAYETDQACLQVKIPFVVTLSIGVTPEGDYTVEEAYGKGPVAKKMHIAKAKSDSQDDTPYAPIDTAYVHYDRETKAPFLTVHGMFSNSCLELAPQNIKMMQTSPGLIEMLPILTYLSDRQCDEGDFPFFRTIPIPANVPAGSYVLYARTLNGGSYTKRIRIERVTPVPPN